MFGHEKGAFTGAAERRLGTFELADTGTLFLDEIGEIPPATQVKLLRVLEEREFMRVGGVQPISGRTCASSPRPTSRFASWWTTGRFRADLFYRLNVLRIYLPPLRERREDIPLLVRRFITTTRRSTTANSTASRPTRCSCWSSIRGRGTCASCAISSRAWSCSRPITRSSPNDLPRHIRESGGGRLLPVHVGPLLRAQDAAAAGGRELEFIVRSLLELKLQVEELRRRIDHRPNDGWIGEVQPGGSVPSVPTVSSVPGIEPRDQPPPPNVVSITPGMTMAEIERAAIEARAAASRAAIAGAPPTCWESASAPCIARSKNTGCPKRTSSSGQ